MALTPAEKMKRYREKLKKNPEKYEEYKKKDLQRIKIKTKKILELTEQEKEQRRKLWREQKRKQKLYKEALNMPQASTSNPPGTKCCNFRVPLKNKLIARKYNAAIKRIQKLQKTLETSRKRYYRLKKHSSKRIEELEGTVLKMKAREEILETSLRKTFNNCKTFKEKRILKNLASNKEVKKNKSVTYVSKLLGLSGPVRSRKQYEQKNKTIQEEIKRFYIRDDISRCTAGKRECKTVKKNKQQIRYLTDRLANLFKIYKKEGGKYNFTSFFNYKPFYVLSPNVQNRETCMCIKHSNMEMLFAALKKNGLVPHLQNMTDLLTKLTCDINSYNCMYGICDKCKSCKVDYKIDYEIGAKRTEWLQWERVDHRYDKIEKGEVKKMITKKTVKQKKEGYVSLLLQKFESNLLAYKIHYFNWKHQQRKYQECISNLKGNEVLILVDFSENYVCKMREEVQSMHFGASKHQITLHCGMIYWKNKSKSFNTISDSKCHEPSGIWAHLMPILELIKEISPEIDTLHFFSDGPTSQYRQKKNFFLLNFITRKFRFSLTTWSFFESGHGKGVADGIGGAIKRALDRQVAYGHDVTNAMEAFEILQNCMKSVKIFYIEVTKIDEISKLIPKDLRPIVGTMRIHQVISYAHSAQIQYRKLSCFCEMIEGQVCNCFVAKKHNFPIISDESHSLPFCLLPCQSETVPESKKDFENLKEHKNETIVFANTEIGNKLITSTEGDVLMHYSDKYLQSKVMEEMDIGDLDSFVHNTLSNESKKETKYNPKDTGKIISRNSSDDLEYCNFAKHPENSLLDMVNNIAANNLIMGLNVNSNKLTYLVHQNDSQNTLKRPRFTCESDKENFSDTKTVKQSMSKSIRTAITRTLQCILCKKNFPFASNCIIQCMVCKNRYCTTCTEGQNSFDYICNKCFGD